MRYFHFSLDKLPIGTHLMGLKSTRKSKHRVGQQHADEVFEKVRKQEYPNAPSLFTSVWLTDGYDPSIPRKQFEENPQVQKGFLYRVDPIGDIYHIEGRWEVEACQIVTWSKLRGQNLQSRLEELARRFWNPELVPDSINEYLGPKGAIIVELEKVVSREDKHA